ncbi:MAG: efflux RND transporter periplasmic adaptor subunit [Desulfobulbales bacterium]
MKKIMVAAAAFLIFTAAGCRDKIEPGTAEVERPSVTGVATMVIEPHPIPLFHEATATVTAEILSTVSSRIMGPVASITVKEGDRVKAGQLLIVIDSEESDKKVAAAEAAYREALQALNGADQQRILAENSYNRFKNLYDAKALSQQEFDRIETQHKEASIEYARIKEMVKRAEAAWAEAKVYQGYKKIVSPVTGIVTAKFIDPGSMAMPGMRLLTIEDVTSYRLEAEMDESLAEKITPGLEVEVTVSALKKTFQSTISEIIPAVDPRSRTFTVYIPVPADTDLHSGFFAKVKIPIGQQESILVPAEALVTRGQLTGVFVVDDSRIITYRLVRVGKQYGNNLEILTGLMPGDTIIIDNVSKAVDGAILQTGE